MAVVAYRVVERAGRTRDEVLRAVAAVASAIPPDRLITIDWYEFAWSAVIWYWADES